MIDRISDRQTFLEIGFLAFGGALLVALWMLVFGRAAGQAATSRRHAEPPPSRGSVPQERHHNFRTVASR